MTTGLGGTSSHSHTLKKAATQTDQRVLPDHTHPDDPALATSTYVDQAIAAHEAKYHATTPPPIPQRFAPPTTTQVTNAPPSGGDLVAWLLTVPDGSRCVFPAGAQYVILASLRLNGRHDLVFEGNGAILHTSGWDVLNSAFHFGKGTGGASHIAIRDFAIVGDNPDGGTVDAFHAGQEGSSGLQVTNGPSYIEVANCHITDQWGHGIYVGSGNVTNAKPDHIWLHDNVIERTGVMGINLGVGTYLWAERNTLNDIAIYPIDFEDGQAGEPLAHVYVSANQINRWGWNSWYSGHAIVGDGSTGMTCDDIVIDSNVLTGGFQSVPQNGQMGQISFIGSDTKTHLVITNNKGMPGAGPTVTIANAPGAVVTGNTP